MREQAEREDRPADFRERCLQRLAVLEEQRDDLAAELTQLAVDIASGRATPKVYRQFKMYNDPQYARGEGSSTAPRAP
jgi:hypothetical protein